MRFYIRFGIRGSSDKEIKTVQRQMRGLCRTTSMLSRVKNYPNRAREIGDSRVVVCGILTRVNSHNDVAWEEKRERKKKKKNLLSMFL